MKLNDIFYFGKHKGQTLKAVMATNGSYVIWCLQNIPNFTIEPQELYEKFMNQYNQWLLSKQHPKVVNHSPFKKGSEVALWDDWDNENNEYW